jgi:hypothetical protein
MAHGVEQHKKYRGNLRESVCLSKDAGAASQWHLKFCWAFGWQLLIKASTKTCKNLFSARRQ